MAGWGIGPPARRAALVAMVAVVGLLAAATAPRARADGDPASDYLLSNQVFLAAQTPTPSAGQRALLATVAAANRAGFAIRVAMVPSQYDLGSITALWGRPQLYARFLSLELSEAYRQRLLVVMPSGFGFAWPGHGVAAEYRSLAGLTIARSDGDLSAATQAAVRRLAAAGGITLPAAPSASAASAPTRTRARRAAASSAFEIAGLAVAALLLSALGTVGIRRRRGGRSGPVGAPVRQPARSLRGRWLVPGIAALFALAVAVPVVLLLALRHPSSTQTAAGAVITPPALRWSAGARVAPDFRLTDQSGRPVSISSFRGRPVILTFTDPLCRNLCPLEAHILNYAVGQLPAAQRPAIIAVSVDVYADTRADLLQDEQRWELVPEWHWAVGARAALAAVWKRYQVGVQVVTKRVGPVTLHYITHSEVAFVIDRSGHMRGMFLWPFYPQDVEYFLHQIS